MKDKKYIDKVVGSLVRSTKMDYDKEEIQFPFLTFILPLPSFSSSSPLKPLPFSEYCKNIYGLNEEEIEYVWNKYIKSIIDKIENGE